MAARTWYIGQIQQLARCTFREAELLGNRILLMSRSKKRTKKVRSKKDEELGKFEVRSKQFSSRLFLGPFRDVKEIPFPRLAVIW